MKIRGPGFLVVLAAVVFLGGCGGGSSSSSTQVTITFEGKKLSRAEVRAGLEKLHTEYRHRIREAHEASAAAILMVEEESKLASSGNVPAERKMAERATDFRKEAGHLEELAEQVSRKHHALEHAEIVAVREPAPERLEHTEEGCAYSEEQAGKGDAEDEEIRERILGECHAEERKLKREVAEEGR